MAYTIICYIWLKQNNHGWQLVKVKCATSIGDSQYEGFVEDRFVIWEVMMYEKIPRKACVVSYK